MRLSEFHRAVDEIFGPTQGSVLVRDLALTDLDSRTAREALAAGVPTADVWRALCRANDVPTELWRGAGRDDPAKRGC